MHMKIERLSATHIIGEQRRYVLYRLGVPQTRPDGWVMVLMANGTKIQNAVCHETGVVEEAAASASWAG